ncbi:FCD domain-containing protein [Psychromonas sp. GE-S-Ul-11]|uniref:GntR family transcriptional regulator n=1 Tax=Psychromonas sp. GE-S-Ul-11 TaxID=3241170 RepID=UPI00390C73B6
MGRNQDLRKIVINQVLEGISTGNLKSPLPSQTSLAELYNVSRTTIRYTINYLIGNNILEYNGSKLQVTRQPEEEDKFTEIKELKTTSANQISQIDNYFTQAINNKEIKPGDIFTEAQIAKSANVDTQVVREYLIRFSRFELIENIHRGKWMMKKFDPSYANKLFELREMLENHALCKFMNLPTTDSRWAEAKLLLNEHRDFRKTLINNPRDFAALDRKLHKLILSAADNPFMDSFFDIISFVFHCHYQWNNSDLRTRNQIAIDEHMLILGKIVMRDDIGALNELTRHLQTAKRTMGRSLDQELLPEEIE